jgi:Bacterial aa3 type cytochrome c oxidase subunit IV
MAAESHYEKGKMDISQNQETFALFWSLTKWGLIVSVGVMAFLAIFFTNQ